MVAIQRFGRGKRSYTRKPTTYRVSRHLGYKFPKRKVPWGFKTNVKMGKGFPRRTCFTHVYNEIVLLTSTSGVPAPYTFNLLGMYDPNTTGTGHQPYYFDQLSALYDHYHVIGAKVELQFIPQNNQTPGTAVKFAAFLNDNPTITASTPDQIAEYQTGKFVLVPFSSIRPVTFRYNFSTHKYFGSGVLANNSLQGTGSANPSEGYYVSMQLQCADGSSTVSGYIRMKITYTAVWTELQDVSAS